MVDIELEHIRAKKWEKLQAELEEREAEAHEVIDAVECSLADGVKHYSIDGILLETVEDILNALLQDGEIYLEDRK